jgi:hypothetical protein
VEKYDGRQGTIPADRGNPEGHATDMQVHLLVPDICGRWCRVRLGCLVCRV